MRVLFCWPQYSGYMAACWRELGALEDVTLRVLAFSPEAGDNAPFSSRVMEGTDHRLLSPEQRDDFGLIRADVEEFRPDAVVVSGWYHPPYRQLVLHRALAGMRVLMAMDTPWKGTWRQRWAWAPLRRLVRRVDGVVVAGERSWQYARQLGFPESRLYRGVYGVDYRAFAAAYEERRTRSEAETSSLPDSPSGPASDRWPRNFLFVGRYEPVKGVDILIEAYLRYRADVGEGEAWPLACCGHGSLGPRLRSVAGVVDHGFVQPMDQPGLFARHGAFVMPSLFEPWGVAIAEAAAAGLPVICTEACAAGIDLVRSHFNGMLIPTGQVAPLAAALGWVHRQADRLPEMGRRSQTLAAPFGAEFWALRWRSALRERRD